MGGVATIVWIVSEGAAPAVAEVRRMRGDDDYKVDVADLREYLCGYFDAVGGCANRLGRSISPVGLTAAGGKVLKVRWRYPGCGKRGGLRMGFAVYCEARKVVVCHASLKRDVDDGELIQAASDGDDYIDEEDGS